MTIRQYLGIMALSSALCWAAFVLVLFRVDPFEANLFGFLFFYTSLFLAFLGTTSVVAFMLYQHFSAVESPMFRLVEKSFRDGVTLSVTFLGILILQGLGLLTLWVTGGFLIVLLTIFLLILLIRRPRRV